MRRPWRMWTPSSPMGIPAFPSPACANSTPTSTIRRWRRSTIRLNKGLAASKAWACAGAGMIKRCASRIFLDDVHTLLHQGVEHDQVDRMVEVDAALGRHDEG